MRPREKRELSLFIWREKRECRAEKWDPAPGSEKAGLYEEAGAWGKGGHRKESEMLAQC